MKDLKIINSGVYRHAQNSRQVMTHQWVSLGVSGLVRHELYYPDGDLAEYFSLKEKPFRPSLALGWPGFLTNFEYDSNRENWVTMFKCESVFFDPEKRGFFMIHDDVSIPVPQRIMLENDELESLRATFRRMTEYYNSAIPRNQLSADLLLSQILLRFLQEPAQEDDLVEHFRKRLDDDAKWEFTLEEHCRILGGNRDHLRRLFEDRYKIGPGVYRTRKRLQKIIHLLAYSRLSLKEIAFECGMKHASHLNRFIRDHYDKTPKELCREYRKKK